MPYLDKTATLRSLLHHIRRGTRNKNKLELIDEALKTLDLPEEAFDVAPDFGPPVGPEDEPQRQVDEPLDIAGR